MLASIQITNFALIEQLHLDFNNGMTVITGETGAGKSIVIDALGLALGERADTSVIRFGCDKTDVTAAFHLTENSEAMCWLEENELQEEGECILRRIVAKEGRSKCFINGRPVTQSMLSELGDKLVDIHGQHAHQSLLKPLHQLALLDELLEKPEVASQVNDSARAYRKVSRQLSQLQQDEEQRKERAELLAYQLQELEILQLSEDSIQQLEQEHAKASNLQQLTESTQSALNDLFDAEPSVYEALQQYQEKFRGLSQKDSALIGIYELLTSATSTLEEAKSELRHYQDALDIDPQKAEELDEQLSNLFNLSRKHQVDMLELPVVEQKIRSELESLQEATDNSSKLVHEQNKLATEYQKQAQQLSKLRAKAAKKLAQEVTEQMQSLGMEGGQFVVELVPAKDQYAGTGMESVEFKVSANPGQPVQPLGKVASGGELSRISLAIQVITAQKRITPCLIFDEVDVGIGGQTADIVGRMLSDIATHAQVLCVTHQPQVAARGDHHLQAAKNRQANHTETLMSSLKDKQRVEEIARMVGGQQITASTLKHARELLAG